MLPVYFSKNGILNICLHFDNEKQKKQKHESIICLHLIPIPSNLHKILFVK